MALIPPSFPEPTDRFTSEVAALRLAYRRRGRAAAVDLATVEVMTSRTGRTSGLICAAGTAAAVAYGAFLYAQADARLRTVEPAIAAMESQLGHAQARMRTIAATEAAAADEKRRAALCWTRSARKARASRARSNRCRRTYRTGRNRARCTSSPAQARGRCRYRRQTRHRLSLQPNTRCRNESGERPDRHSRRIRGHAGGAAYRSRRPVRSAGVAAAARGGCGERSRRHVARDACENRHFRASRVACRPDRKSRFSTAYSPACKIGRRSSEMWRSG